MRCSGDFKLGTSIVNAAYSILEDCEDGLTGVCHEGVVDARADFAEC